MNNFCSIEHDNSSEKSPRDNTSIRFSTWYSPLMHILPIKTKENILQSDILDLSETLQFYHNMLSDFYESENDKKYKKLLTRSVFNLQHALFLMNTLHTIRNILINDISNKDSLICVDFFSSMWPLYSLVT